MIRGKTRPLGNLPVLARAPRASSEESLGPRCRGHPRPHFCHRALLLKKSPSLPEDFSVEYVESKTNNVMVYEVEPTMTVIWILEGTEEEAAPS